MTDVTPTPTPDLDVAAAAPAVDTEVPPAPQAPFAPRKRKSALGTWALVLGIIGIFFALIPHTSGFGIFLAVVGLVLGGIGLLAKSGRARVGAILAALAFVLGIIFVNVYGAGGSPSDRAASDVSKVSSSPGKAAAPSKPVKPAKPAKPEGTVSQLQALDSAQDYLSEGQGFSEAGLIGQLSSKYGEGFAKADAIWAVEHSDADWNAQAVDSAEGYLSEGTGFSKAGLISQLTSREGEQFTKAQAVYAVEHSDADWNAQAVDSAKGYLALGGFSRRSLIAQLTSSYGEKFTLAQATYAVTKVGL